MEKKYWQPEIESAPREKIRQIQLEKIKKLVDRAYKDTIFYRRRLDAAGIKPADIRTLEDFQKIPPTRYLEDFVATPIAEKLAVPMDKVVGIISTSGTLSGSPQPVMVSEGDLEVWTDSFARFAIMYGIKKGDILQMLFPFPLLERAISKVGATLVPATAVTTFFMDNAVKLMNNVKPNVIFAAPALLLMMNRRAAELGIDMKKIGIRTVILGGESWSNTYRQKMEQEWGARFYDVYGLVEIGHPFGECLERTGMHCWEDLFLTEIVDPETGKALGPGEPGEIILSSLWREAMPLLRYRTGDVAQWLEYKPCGCGRTLAKISRIKGRTEHMVKVGGAKIFPVDMEEVIQKFTELTGEYQIVLTKPGIQDMLEVKAEYRSEVVELGALNRKLASELEQSTKVKTKVELAPYGTLAPAGGWKAQRIVKTY
jgi:phenylacetate-CoA ligase